MYTFTQKTTSYLETKVWPTKEDNMVATVHTHPFLISRAYSDEKYNYQIVSEDDIDYGNDKSVDMYIYRADGVLVKYDYKTGKIVKVKLKQEFTIR